MVFSLVFHASNPPDFSIEGRVVLGHHAHGADVFLRHRLDLRDLDDFTRKTWGFFMIFMGIEWRFWWGLNGIWWDFMVIEWNLWWFNGILWWFNGILLWFNGILWWFNDGLTGFTGDLMELNGDLMVISWKLMGLERGFVWDLMGIEWRKMVRWNSGIKRY